MCAMKGESFVGKNLTEKRRILVVDDQAPLRIFLERLLTKEGHQVVTASSGPNALKVFNAKKIDLAIIDIQLGTEPDGFMVARMILKKQPNLQIVLMSGDPTNKAKIIRNRLGVFLEKPMDIYLIRKLTLNASPVFF